MTVLGRDGADEWTRTDAGPRGIGLGPKAILNVTPRRSVTAPGRARQPVSSVRPANRAGVPGY